jgi:predicted exporter
MPGKSLLKLKVRVSAAVSAAVCVIAALLPYKARQGFVFLLHFLLNGLLVKLKLVANWMITVFAYVLFLPVYFIGIPFTLFLRKIAFRRSDSAFVPGGEEVKDDDLERMF